MPGRIERVKKMIKNEISAILSGDINDPRIKHVMITDVEMSRDLRNATVLYTVEDEETPKEDVSRRLKRAGSFIRAELAERISMKYMPRIIFREDRAQEREESVNRLFDLIAGEREDKEDRNGKDA